MTGNEIRKRFLEHFASREHKVLPSAPLVPKDDPSTLFISAGMQPLQPYYLGLSDPPAPRLASAQKCLRTGDIDEVGRTDRHNTFFEMLGNFTPTGAYFKETAIPLAWELVTGGFQMPVERLRVTIHQSDDQDLEIWLQTGVARDRVTRLGDNWWGLGRGHCGPDSEIWWDRGKDVGCGRDDCVPDHCERFTEFWNLVFPQYDQRGDLSGPPSTAEAIHRGIADGALVPLARPAIDTGMGLERISYILQGKASIFETDLLAPLVDFVRQGSEKPTALSERVIAEDRKSTRLNSSHRCISYAVFCLKCLAPAETATLSLHDALPISDGALVPLARPAIDTGMGLERISYILQGKASIFETDLLAPLVDFVRQGSEKPTALSERVIA